jgi:hypothetical protein
MQKSMNAYVKTISKRSELEAKEKILPIAHMGGTMITHGSDFEPDSEYGQCLNRETTKQPLVNTLLILKQCWAEQRSVLRGHRRITLIPPVRHGSSLSKGLWSR